jgi:hypothetical protein
VSEVIEGQIQGGNKRYTICLVLTELDLAKADVKELDCRSMFQGNDETEAKEAFETIRAEGADFYRRCREFAGKEVKSGRTD